MDKECGLTFREINLSGPGLRANVKARYTIFFFFSRESNFGVQGTMTMKSGDVYVGEWKNNQMEGHGMYTRQIPYMKYTGPFVNGKVSHDCVCRYLH